MIKKKQYKILSFRTIIDKFLVTFAGGQIGIPRNFRLSSFFVHLFSLFLQLSPSSLSP